MCMYLVLQNLNLDMLGIFDTVLLDQYTGIGNNIDTVVPDRFDTLTCPIARLVHSVNCL